MMSELRSQATLHEISQATGTYARSWETNDVAALQWMRTTDRELSLHSRIERNVQGDEEAQADTPMDEAQGVRGDAPQSSNDDDGMRQTRRSLRRLMLREGKE